MLKVLSRHCQNRNKNYSVQFGQVLNSVMTRISTVTTVHYVFAIQVKGAQVETVELSYWYG